MGDVLVFNEGRTWVRDYYNWLWDIWDLEARKNLYLIVKYLELKKGQKPTINGLISRTLFENEYDLVGYGVIRMNDDIGKFTFGTFTIPLHEGPVYVEEVRPEKKNGRILKVTIAHPTDLSAA